MPHEGAQPKDLTGQPIGGVDRSQNPPEFHIFSVDANGVLNVNSSGGGGGGNVNITGINSTAPAVTNPLFVELSDGTHPLGTVGNPVFVETAGVGVQPTEDAADATVGSAPPSTVIMVGVKDAAGHAQDLSGLALGATVKAATVAIMDASGNQITSFGSSASVGTTGSAVPASANYEGINVAGTLRGQTGVNPSGSIFAEQVDVASVAGTTIDTNSGAKSAGTIRVVLATDQPTMTNPQPVTISAGSAVIGHVITDAGSVTTATTNADTTIGGTTAPSKGLLAIGKTNDGTPQYQPIPEGAGGRSIIIEGVASGTAVPISGSISVTGNPAVVGTKTNNNAAPGANNIGVLPAIANAAAPSYTEGDQVLTSLDLSGNTRIIGSVSVTGNPAVVGTKTNNNAAPGANNVGVLPAIANAAAPTYTEGDQVLASVDLTGSMRTFQSELPLDISATGNITANNQNVAIATNGVDGIIIVVSGTFVATLQPQFQLPDSTWVNGSIIPTLPSGVTVSTVTAPGQWKTFGGGFKGFRMLSTAYTSGTAVVSIEGSQASTVSQVFIKGANGGSIDGTTAAAVPTNAVQVGDRAATAYPTAVTDGQLVAPMADKAGRAVTVLNAPRDLVGTAVLTSASSSLVSLIAAGAAGVFNDITTFIATNETSTATIVSLSDGTTTYKYAIAANGGIVMNFATPKPAASTATAWQVSNSSGVSVDYEAIFVKNK